MTQNEALIYETLLQFHREVFLPDFERLLDEMFERRIKPRFDEINGHFDANPHEARQAGEQGCGP